MIDATGLTKVFGDKVAVDNLSFSVRSGMVTGFLGPNGAGKSTTMRMILGLDYPTKGHCRVNGRSYPYSKAPMTEVGALLEAKSVHPGRTARSHLTALAATHGIPRKRVDEVIELVGLSAVADKRAGEFSLGMGQRLGLAAALLGDPETLILDEPINGLDPEGVAWVRSLLKYLAEEGRTVFISSHLMSEMAMTADHIIIIGRGRLISDSPMSDLIERASGRVLKVRSPDAAQIREVVTRSGRTVTDTDDGAILISGLSAEAIGKEAMRREWTLYELTPVQRSLEDIYMELTNSSQEFRSEGHFNELALSRPIELAPPEEPEEELQEEPEYEDDEAEDEIEAHISRPASLDERSRTNEVGYRTASPRYDPSGKPRMPEPDLAARPRTAEPNAAAWPRIADPAPGKPRPAQSRSYDDEPMPRPRLADPDPAIRPRTSDAASLYGSRPSDPMPHLRLAGPDPVSTPRPRLSGSEPVPSSRSRLSDPDPLPRPRVADPAPVPRQRLADPAPAPRQRLMDPDPMPRPRLDSDPLPRPRLTGPDPRPRLTDRDPRSRLTGPDPQSRPRLADPSPDQRSRLTDSDSVPRSRPRLADPDPMPRLRPRSVDSDRSTSDPLPRRTDPVPRPRFMDTDTDYRTRPRPTDSDVYRSRPQQETSADPLRLPRPRAEQDSLPISEPKPSAKTSDPNRPRRAWGV